MATKKSKNAKTQRKSLACNVCESKIEVPYCCESEMKYSDGKLTCSLCGSREEIQICCGNKMGIATSDIEEE